MTNITLQAHAEKLAPPNAVPHYRGKNEHRLLYHQVRTYNALANAPLVMNTYPTGTGKTEAALLWLLHPQRKPGNALVIAPTNELVRQHSDDIKAFVERNDLDMSVVAIDAKTLKGCAPHTPRAGDRMTRLLQNPLVFQECLKLQTDAQRKPYILVTNPDIFYLALYFQYGRLDQRNMFHEIIQKFRYIVIDEFHYYDSKQFASFLFFFGLWKLWSYFEMQANNRVCLLSATPRRQVYQYLDRVFGQQAWTLIAPDNEPEESATLETTPTLTPLHMTVAAGAIDEWVEEHAQEVAAWPAAELDSAIISSSLARINRINHVLRGRGLDPVRITGPATRQERQRVGRLVLATPTVDIGYNFGRPDKLRQSIDRLVCDARFGDEVTQRIGRVGRVLGRQETTTPSEAVVLVGDDAATELAKYDGQQLSRAEWATIVQGLEHLPPKHQLDSYIAQYALREAFYPIFQVWKQAGQEVQQEVETELFDMIRAIFAPSTKQSAWQLRLKYEKYRAYHAWVQKSEKQRWSLGDDWNTRDLAQVVTDYMSCQASFKGQKVHLKPHDIKDKLPMLLRHEQKKRDIERFAESNVALIQALFAFREAWQGTIAGIYDPQQLLSDKVVNQYDLLHIVANYNIRIFEHYTDFQKACGSSSADIADDLRLYVELQDFRDPPLTIGFRYNEYELEREDFETRYCRQVVALQGFELEAEERGTKSRQRVLLPAQVTDVIQSDWVPCLIVEQQYQGPLIRKLRGSPFYSRRLMVEFESGHVEYALMTGTAALHVFAALVGYFKMLERTEDDDCIIL